MRGQWIPFDEDAINQFLGHPLVLEEGQRCEFSQRRSQASGFDEEAISQLLCVPGQDFAWSMAGRRVQIMHTSMTTLTQIWMTLLLNNILPSEGQLPKIGPNLQCQQIPNLVSSLPINTNSIVPNPAQMGGTTSEFNHADHKHPLSLPHELMPMPAQKSFNNMAAGTTVFTRSLSSTSSPFLQLSSIVLRI